MKCTVLCLLICTAGAHSLDASTPPGRPSSPDTYAIKQKNLCGHYCLVSVLQHLGKNVQAPELVPAARAEDGTNLAQLKTLAEAYGLKTLGAKITKDLLFAMRRPAILISPCLTRPKPPP